MRIAESRAKEKAYRAARNVLNKMLEDFEEIKYSTNSFKSLYESETEHLKKLTDNK